VVTLKKSAFCIDLGLDQMGAPEGPHCSLPTVHTVFLGASTV